MLLAHSGIAVDRQNDACISSIGRALASYSRLKSCADGFTTLSRGVLNSCYVQNVMSDNPGDVYGGL